MAVKVMASRNTALKRPAEGGKKQLPIGSGNGLTNTTAVSRSSHAALCEAAYGPTCLRLCMATLRTIENKLVVTINSSSLWISVICLLLSPEGKFIAA